MPNVTLLPPRGSPFEDVTPRRRLNSHVVGLTQRHGVARSAFSAIERTSRGMSVSRTSARIDPASGNRSWWGSTAPSVPAAGGLVTDEAACARQ